MFFSFPLSTQVLLPAESVMARHRVCVGGTRGRLVAPQYPFPHLACELHDLHWNPQGGGGESFQILDAVEFNAFCFLACPHPGSGRRALLSSASECCSVSACSDSPNPFFSFCHRKISGVLRKIARIWHIYICILFLKQSYQGKKAGAGAAGGIYFSPNQV